MLGYFFQAIISNYNYACNAQNLLLSLLPSTVDAVANKKTSMFWAVCECWVIVSQLLLVTATFNAMRRMYRFSSHLPVVLHNKESGTFCTMHARLYLLVLAWDR